MAKTSRSLLVAKAEPLSGLHQLSSEFRVLAVLGLFYVNIFSSIVILNLAEQVHY